MSRFLGNIRIATLGLLMSVLLIVTGGAFIANSVFTLTQVGQMGTTWESFNDGPAKKVIQDGDLFRRSGEKGRHPE